MPRRVQESRTRRQGDIRAEMAIGVDCRTTANAISAQGATQKEKPAQERPRELGFAFVWIIIPHKSHSQQIAPHESKTRLKTGPFALGFAFVWLKNPHESHSQQIVPQQTQSQLRTATLARGPLAPSGCLSPCARKPLCRPLLQSKRRFGCRFHVP